MPIFLPQPKDSYQSDAAMATKEWLKHVEVMQRANVQAVGRERHQLLGLRTTTRTLCAGFSFKCNLATCSITCIMKEHF